MATICLIASAIEQSQTGAHAPRFVGLLEALDCMAIGWMLFCIGLLHWRQLRFAKVFHTHFVVVWSEFGGARCSFLKMFCLPQKRAVWPVPQFLKMLTPTIALDAE